MEESTQSTPKERKAGYEQVCVWPGTTLEPVDFSDKELADFLNSVNPKWTWDSIANFNRFISDGVVIAIVKYKNTAPLARWIWINEDLIKGYVIIKDDMEDLTRYHQGQDKVYCADSSYPCNMEPTSTIYEDESGTYWLKGDLKKEGKV